MATKEPIDSVEEAPAVKDAGELVSDVAETIAAKAIQAAQLSSKTTFIDGQKVSPEQSAATARKPQPKAAAKAPVKGPHDSVSDGDDDREGFSDAYDQTYGPGAFTYKEGKEQFDMDNAGRFTNTPSSVYGTSMSFDSPTGAKSESLQQTETWFGIAEQVMGGDGNPYTSDLAFSYDAHDFSNPYSQRFDTLNDYNVLSQARYENGILNIGNSCARPGGAIEEAAREGIANVNAWKTDSALVQQAQKATVDEETGMVHLEDGRVLDPKTDTEAQRIVAAKIGMALEPEKAAPMAFKPKAELDAMAAENPLFKKPEILAKNEVGTVPPADFKLKTHMPTISGIGQAGDLGYTYQSIEELTASALKGNTLAAKTTPGADPLAGLDGQKLKPMGMAAPAPAGPAPAAPAPV